MNNKALTLSLFMAIVAVFFVQSYVSSIEEETKKKFGTEVMVVVAKKDIKEMDSINENALEFKVIPKRFREPAAIELDKKDDNERAKSLKSLTGAVAIVPIKKGEQITYNKLSEPSIRTGLAPQISPGRRAIAIPINDSSGIAKLVKPGDRVDLISVLDMGGRKDQKVVKTLLQDVVVLATGRQITNNVPRLVETDSGGEKRIRNLTEDATFGTVTLEVEPFQAQMISLLIASGDNSMFLSLRNNDDTDRVNLPTMMFNDLLGVDASRRLPAGR